MRSHDVDYEIFGDDMQVVEIELDPEETVIAEAGVMNWMEDGIEFEARLGDGSKMDQGLLDKIFGAAMRTISGESLFMTHFTNISHVKRRVAFGAPYPGEIIPVDLSQHHNELLCQKHSFLCAAKGTQISVALVKRFGTGLFGGEGFILQRLRGDGLAFIHACGTVIKKELYNEVLRVDTGCIVAFTAGIDYDIQRAGSLKSMFFAGEGMFLATLSGIGTVFLQSLPFSRMADRIIRSAPSMRGKQREEGSLLGRFGDMADGDNR